MIVESETSRVRRTSRYTPVPSNKRTSNAISEPRGRRQAHERPRTRPNAACCLWAGRLCGGLLSCGREGSGARSAADVELRVVGELGTCDSEPRASKRNRSAEPRRARALRQLLRRGPQRWRRHPTPRPQAASTATAAAEESLIKSKAQASQVCVSTLAHLTSTSPAARPTARSRNQRS